MNGSFQNDQVQLDPKNNVTPTPGKHTQGPFMIMIGAAAVLIREANEGAATADMGVYGIELGLRMALHCLHKHTNSTHATHATAEKCGFPAGSCWEYIDDSGGPYTEPATGVVASDPGHALEFVGLSAWLVREAERSQSSSSPPPSPTLAAQQAELAVLRAALPQLLRTNFRNGFVGKGICKGFDLREGTPVSFHSTAALIHHTRAPTFRWMSARSLLVQYRRSTPIARGGACPRPCAPRARSARWLCLKQQRLRRRQRRRRRRHWRCVMRH